MNVALYWGQKQSSIQRAPLLPSPLSPPSSFDDACIQASQSHRQSGDEVSFYWFSPFWTLAWYLSSNFKCRLGSLFDFQSLDLRPDVILVVDLPRQREDFERLRRAYPSTPFILLVAETPLERHSQHAQRNFEHFSAVVTYSLSYSDSAKPVFFYRLPFSFYRPSTSEPSPFSENRRLTFCSYIGNAHTAGWRRNIQYQLGFRGLPVLWQYQTGWTTPARAALYDELYNGYNKRRHVLSALSQHLGSDLTIYGSGWCKSGAGWTRKIPRIGPNRVLPSRPVGITLGSKHAILQNSVFTLALENYTGHPDYISEKLFDAMAAGSIPIYMGHPSALPPGLNDTVIDISDIMAPLIPNQSALINRLIQIRTMSQEEIIYRQSQCLSYMANQYLLDYGHHQFFDAVIKALRCVAFI